MSPPLRRDGLRGSDRGSAVVEFSLVAGLTTLVLLAVLQLGLALHVRATLVDCAAEGARYGALADRDPTDGVVRTEELIASALAPGYAQDVRADRLEVGGVPVVRVQVRAPLPVLGLLGPGGVIAVDAHALDEGALAP